VRVDRPLPSAELQSSDICIMSSVVFRVQEHQVPSSHIREYPRATAGEQEDVLYLAVKQYTPSDNVQARAGDITIIAAHANGFPKVALRLSTTEELMLTHSRSFMSLFGTSCTAA